MGFFLGHGLFAIYKFSIFDHFILVLAPLVRLVPPVMVLSQLVPHIRNFEISQTINISEFPWSTFHFTGIQITYRINISNRTINILNLFKTTPNYNLYFKTTHICYSLLICLAASHLAPHFTCAKNKNKKRVHNIKQ